MNCESVADNIPGIVSGSLPATELADSRQHFAECRSCREALRGAEALAMLQRRDTGDVPGDLFDQVLAGLDLAPAQRRTDRRFWLGACVGGAVAASLFAVAFMIAFMTGWIGPPASDTSEAEFMVTLSGPRTMDIAIEADRPLRNARISVFLSGGIGLDGYGDRRELSWVSDLNAGVNKLSLPVVALDERGGQVLVQLSHPQSEQLFVVRLKTSA